MKSDQTLEQIKINIGFLFTSETVVQDHKFMSGSFELHINDWVGNAMIQDEFVDVSFTHSQTNETVNIHTCKDLRELMMRVVSESFTSASLNLLGEETPKIKTPRDFVRFIHNR